ncbi:iron transporter [Candidatus Liberibacter americanus]|uniref:Periplasmic protein p19 involved in high-affinity Fe2+ transport n=1 Tax=Candidatus Liberibacter americanus str. Sao Paulo TaxID=1261131 RepID=U6B5D6_9HYPH|nr:iron transporter [Candidatus Liberibacter americanus]AHA27863.1 hypothetical protein lam_504 [Candidatus Liberibacter americanus str. Sao Paulo]EMS35906.1 hypothetical protein G653_04261 [Candidatus Liberibacter americanus PW_SP]
MRIFYFSFILIISILPSAVFAKEYPLGSPVIKNGMEIQGVYLQPITMDIDHSKRRSSHLGLDKYDIHLEADIRSVQDNPNGFAQGDWLPYLHVEYIISKIGDDAYVQSGSFMPMVASDGPHYGKNIKLNGYGKYNVTYKIYPPSHNKKQKFARHTDKETGVAPWFAPFEVNWEFDYAGIGIKGNY